MFKYSRTLDFLGRSLTSRIAWSHARSRGELTVQRPETAGLLPQSPHNCGKSWVKSVLRFEFCQMTCFRLFFLYQMIILGLFCWIFCSSLVFVWRWRSVEGIQNFGFLWEMQWNLTWNLSKITKGNPDFMKLAPSHCLLVMRWTAIASMEPNSCIGWGRTWLFSIRGAAWSYNSLDLGPLINHLWRREIHQNHGDYVP